MAYDAFLKFDGIEGESTDQQHKGEVDVLSFHWGVSQAATACGRNASKPQLHDFTFMKKTDKSSPLLFLACAEGSHIKSATLTVRKAGERPLEFLKYRLSDVLISSYMPGGNSAADDIPMEQVSLNFAKIEVDYMTQDATGQSKQAAASFNFCLRSEQ